MPNIFEQAAAALSCTDIERKQVLTAALHRDWQHGRLDSAPMAIAAEGGRPLKPELVPPDQLPRRLMNSAEGRAAMIH
ncbi:MAG TPA: DUF455 domain-containing protein, partial [Rhodocyclaceae bacterium]|nr:DUF455 domain-containing protein [Rhodocyclaceae bacterium]